ncbi:MAG: nitroreductase family protein [Eubacteriales bacterium]|nr:nitroreductase family protein [Eubacteriales bacterium]MDD3074156.1 nitroreductase family protein [Eubacteriales bacterium]MDD4078874.1 nitroreductase family protein [Eubacteriales bacterium]MDD4768737.1 nitroreductase family protein [Eubacteriales bacterium]
MKIGEAFSRRRSIRKFKSEPVPRELIGQVLEAATLAPSGKNAQPWEFIVLEGVDKEKIAALMVAGAEQLEASGYKSGSARNSAQIVQNAQAVIMVYNPRQKRDAKLTPLRRIMWSVDTQSVGAAIQNLLLKAVELGLGSLWICDVFVAEEQISAWLGRKDELLAAVALGWPDEEPAPRPRKPWQQVTHWGRGH